MLCYVVLCCLMLRYVSRYVLLCCAMLSYVAIGCAIVCNGVGDLR